VGFLIGAGPKAKFKLDVMKKATLTGLLAQPRRAEGSPPPAASMINVLCDTPPSRYEGPSYLMFYRIEGLRRSCSLKTGEEAMKLRRGYGNK
jgi:hypothetical protein